MRKTFCLSFYRWGNWVSGSSSNLPMPQGSLIEKPGFQFTSAQHQQPCTPPPNTGTEFKLSDLWTLNCCCSFELSLNLPEQIQNLMWRHTYTFPRFLPLFTGWFQWCWWCGWWKATWVEDDEVTWQSQSSLCPGTLGLSSVHFMRKWDASRQRQVHEGASQQPGLWLTLSTGTTPVATSSPVVSHPKGLLHHVKNWADLRQIYLPPWDGQVSKTRLRGWIPRFWKFHWPRANDGWWQKQPVELVMACADYITHKEGGVWGGGPQRNSEPTQVTLEKSYSQQAPALLLMMASLIGYCRSSSTWKWKEC